MTIFFRFVCLAIASVPAVTLGKTKELKLDINPPAIGTKFDFRIRMSSARLGTKSVEESWLVSGFSEGRIKWLVDGKEYSETSLNPFLPMLESGTANGREDVSRTFEGDDKTIFPLAPGRFFKIKAKSKNGTTKQEQSYNYRCIVGGKIKTKTPAGTFEVFEVKCLASGKGVNYSAIHLYAPELGTNVYVERLPSKENGFSMRRELVGIKRP